MMTGFVKKSTKSVMVKPPSWNQVLSARSLLSSNENGSAMERKTVETMMMMKMRKLVMMMMIMITLLSRNENGSVKARDNGRGTSTRPNLLR